MSFLVWQTGDFREQEQVSFLEQGAELQENLIPSWIDFFQSTASQTEWDLFFR